MHNQFSPLKARHELVETLLEQPTSYASHIEKLNQHFEAHRNNTLELYKLLNIEWPSDLPFADFETKCREQGLHCEFPITLDSAIIMLTVVKTSNSELRNELIRKNGDLKSVRDTVKAFEIAKEGSEIVTSGECKDKEEEHQVHTNQSKEVNKITRPGRYSMRNSTPDRATGNPATKPVCTGCGNDAHPKGSSCPAK